MVVDVNHFLEGKSLLITGGTGSFGQVCAKFLLEKTKVGRVVIFPAMNGSSGRCNSLTRSSAIPTSAFS